MSEHEHEPTEEPGAEPVNPDEEAEQEPAEPGPGTESEPGETPPAPDEGAGATPPENGAQAELFAALEKALEQYQRKVGKLLAPNEPPPACEHCEGTGYNFGAEPAVVTLRESPTSEECADCGGYGKVLTGSRVPTEEVGACPTCNGAGWRVKLNLPPVPAQPQLEPVGSGAAPSWMGDVNQTTIAGATR